GAGRWPPRPATPEIAALAGLGDLSLGALMRPPSGLREALRHDADKQAWADWAFSRGAPRYDLGNDLMSAGWHSRWKRRLVALADLRPDHHVLDLACGTGDVALLAAERAGHVVGADINPDMLAIARRKLGAPRDDVRFVRAD